MLQLTGTIYNAQEKIWSGPVSKNLYSDEMTVGEAIVLQLQKRPEKIIQIVDSTGETQTSQEFLENSLTLAGNILKMGLKPKDIVGLYARNSQHTATVMMASFLCGTPVNALYPDFDKRMVYLLM